jgi:hypothetical protein
LYLEYYLCHAFQYENSAPSRDWWCDGVIELSIRDTRATSFTMIGAAYWAKSSSPFYLAPLEIEMEFAATNAGTPLRAVVRFGEADELGNIVKSRHNADASRMVAVRPTRNSDWAFAIELTPQNTT